MPAHVEPRAAFAHHRRHARVLLQPAGPLPWQHARSVGNNDVGLVGPVRQIVVVCESVVVASPGAERRPKDLERTDLRWLALACSLIMEIERCSCYFLLR